MNLKDKISELTWVCPECGAWNAEWLDKCGRCNNEKDA
jgi:ribosomal protein S27AE